MADRHRTNVLVTSCLKTPVDPHTKTPLALYERRGPGAPRVHLDPRDHRDHDQEIEYSDAECEDDEEEDEDEDEEGVRFGPERLGLQRRDYRAPGEGDHLHLQEIFFSNQEYYGKLEELKKAHLRTMAELENMYRKKLQLSGLSPQRDPRGPSVQSGFPCADPSSAMRCGLRKARSALELRRVSGLSSDEDEEAWTEEEGAQQDVEKGQISSPKEHIKNMWLDFKLDPEQRHPSSSSLRSLPAGGGGGRKGKKNSKSHREEEEEEDAKRESWRHRVTVPRPFQMTRREAEQRQSGVKTRSEVELENAALRRQLDELSECQRKFRASPVPAHVRLPLYEELQERAKREREEQQREQNLRIAPKPFSFLAREQRRKDQREQQQLRLLQTSSQQEVKPFRAQPVPRAVYAAAAGEHVKEEQLYRSIKMQMRARELLHSSAMPPGMLARSLDERKKTKEPAAGEGEGPDFSHRPKINTDVPDFDAKHRHFKKHLERRKELRPVTSCEPFNLRTAQIASHHRDRSPAGVEKETSPRLNRWPYVAPPARHTPSSSLCSSLSGSLELLPAKVTDASKKRQEAVRKQDLQRKREYQQEIKEIQERVKERPLLLEQVAQRNAKTAVERRCAEALRGCGLTEGFLSGTGNGSPRSARTSRSSCKSDSPVGYQKKLLVGHSSGSGLTGGTTKHGEEGEEESEGERLASSRQEDNSHSADESYHYSDDQDNFSDGQETNSDDSEEEEEQEEEEQEEEKHSDKTSLHTENSTTLNKAHDEEN
ncbi:unnamed protein product [Merluccius merluccius]